MRIKAMHMTSDIKQILFEVQARISPKPAEKKRIVTIGEQLIQRIEEIAREEKIVAKVRLEGSVAKNTWLSESPDIDIFMRVPSTVPRKDLGDLYLEIARKATAGQEQVERFAEHPYLEAKVNGTRVNIVPCYDVKRGEWKSATDRTPYHTDYMKHLLKTQTCNDIRILKKFMKSIGVYGAEIKVGGFSGYICELLTLFYGSFLDVLKSAGSWKVPVHIDLEGHFKGKEAGLETAFSEQLVVVDPIDEGRNAASAVRSDPLSVFITASRAFLQKPDLEFFYPLVTKPFTTENLSRAFKNRRSDFIFILSQVSNRIPDILWGQLYRSKRTLEKLLKHHGFSVTRNAVWSDEQDLNVFLVEVEHRYLPLFKRHAGPLLYQEEECKNFLRKHVNSEKTLSGPWVENGRWVVEIKREYSDVVELLKTKFKDKNKTFTLKELSRNNLKGMRVLVNEEISLTYRENQDFARFLTEYLNSRPKWLT
jgi:tRNA nucleotidyltransferase (CCA-adding enzyme)